MKTLSLLFILALSIQTNSIFAQSYEKGDRSGNGEYFNFYEGNPRNQQNGLNLRDHMKACGDALLTNQILQNKLFPRLNNLTIKSSYIHRGINPVNIFIFKKLMFTLVDQNNVLYDGHMWVQMEGDTRDCRTMVVPRDPVDEIIFGTWIKIWKRSKLSGYIKEGRRSDIVFRDDCAFRYLKQLKDGLSPTEDERCNY